MLPNIEQGYAKFVDFRNKTFKINGNTPFDIAFDWAMYNENGGGYNGNEGPDGYSNDKDDTGGFTRYGFAQNTNNFNPKSLTLQSAKEKYRQTYWNYIKGDQLDPVLATFLFDFGCGSGIGSAVMYTQEELGVIPDGSVGPKTINAAHDYIQHHGREALLQNIAKRRISRYNRKIAKIPSNDKYLIGWSGRTYFTLVPERKTFFAQNQQLIKSFNVPTEIHEEFYK